MFRPSFSSVRRGGSACRWISGSEARFAPGSKSFSIPRRCDDRTCSTRRPSPKPGRNTWMEETGLPSSGESSCSRRGSRNGCDGLTAVRRLSRSAVFALLRFSGLPFLLRELWQRNKVTIVGYHDLDAARAGVHFAALRARYTVISLSHFLEARSGRAGDPLPRKALIITFDDGHRGNYRLASVIERHRIPVTIFVCSGVVGTHRHYWWLHAKDAREAQALKAVPDEQRVRTLLGRGHADTREYE